MGSYISTSLNRSLALTTRSQKQLTFKYLTLQPWKNIYITGFLVSFLLGYKLLRNVFQKRVNLKGKLAIVTGASSGIGLAIATELAAEGATVCLVARTKEKLHEIATELKSKGFDAFYVSADLSKPEDVKKCHQQVTEIVGDRPIDILVNNAGAGKWKFIEETSMEECNSMMALPYFASFYMTRVFLPNMLSVNSGYIINVNSPVSLQPWPGCTGYACARFAMKGFTEALRMDLKGTGVKVMEVIAGETNSNYFEANGIDDSNFPYIAQWIPKISPSEVGRSTVDGLIQNRSRVIYPMTLSFMLGLAHYFPSILRSSIDRTPAGDKRIQNIKKKSEKNVE